MINYYEPIPYNNNLTNNKKYPFWTREGVPMSETDVIVFYPTEADMIARLYGDEPWADVQIKDRYKQIDKKIGRIIYG